MPLALALSGALACGGRPRSELPVAEGAGAGGGDGGQGTASPGVAPPAVFASPSPPLGWNTWNHFHCAIDEALVRQSADAIVASGLLAAGYEYVVIDDCWARSRDAQGALVADPSTFPNGIAALAAYVHADGLKLGLYTAAGERTCAGRPGSYGHERQDAETFAAWGVDFVKEDWCVGGGRTLDAPTQYRVFRDAIDEAAGGMVFSVCTAGADWPIEWAPPLSAMWRTTADINRNPSFGGALDNFHASAEGAAVASAGHANDPDILEVGNGTMTATEERAHFSLWAISAAPLMLGNDVRSMTGSTFATLANAEVIAVDQDPAGVPATLVADEGGVEVWSRPLATPGARAVVVLNPTEAPAAAAVSWTSIGLGEGAARVRDLWAHADLGELGAYRATVAPHDVAMITVHGQDALVPAGGPWDVGRLVWTYAATGQGAVARDQASGGVGMRIAGVSYERGLGVHSESSVSLALGGRCSTFSATVGVDDAFEGSFRLGGGPTFGTVTFEVWADGEQKVGTGVLVGGAPPRRVEADLRGAQTLRLVVTGAGDSTQGDFADWADAVIDCR